MKMRTIQICAMIGLTLFAVPYSMTMEDSENGKDPLEDDRGGYLVSSPEQNLEGTGSILSAEVPKQLSKKITRPKFADQGTFVKPTATAREMRVQKKGLTVGLNKNPSNKSKEDKRSLKRQPSNNLKEAPKPKLQKTISCQEILIANLVVSEKNSNLIDGSDRKEILEAEIVSHEVPVDEVKVQKLFPQKTSSFFYERDAFRAQVEEGAQYGKLIESKRTFMLRIEKQASVQQDFFTRSKEPSK